MTQDHDPITGTMPTTPSGEQVGAALLDALRYVANECQRNPMDSVRDILNEAFDTYDLPLHAEWSDDPEQPVSIRI
jgi:hypothetical protein